MLKNHKPCPKCGRSMNRQSPQCRACFLKIQSSPERRKAMSEARKGKPSYERTPEIRAKMSAAQTGRRHSWRSASTRPEVAAKIRQWWSPKRKEGARIRGLRLASDRAWRDMIARSVMGAKNPRYRKLGKATGYGPGWGRLHKRLIRERDGNQCVQCWATGRLDTNHKDGSKDNHHPDNLVTLCRKCHANQPGDRRNKTSRDLSNKFRPL